MGIPTQTQQAAPAGDAANAVVSGQLTAAAGAGSLSSSFSFYGPFNVILYGPDPPNGDWQGLVQLERSFDGGNTWVVCGVGGSGAQAIWGNNAAAYNQDISVTVGEPEKGVLYRLHCTAFTSGPINYRMSGNGAAAMSLSVATPI